MPRYYEDARRRCTQHTYIINMDSAEHQMMQRRVSGASEILPKTIFSYAAFAASVHISCFLLPRYKMPLNAGYFSSLLLTSGKIFGARDARRYGGDRLLAAISR